VVKSWKLGWVGDIIHRRTKNVEGREIFFEEANLLEDWEER
jgi:hypothetical protein